MHLVSSKRAQVLYFQDVRGNPTQMVNLSWIQTNEMLQLWLNLTSQAPMICGGGLQQASLLGQVEDETW